MEPRPWHRHYDPDVPRSIEYPEVPLQRFLDDSAAKFPDRIAIAFLGRHIAYSELKDQCDAFAQGLHDLGVKRGDRVALYLPNVPHMIIGYYGAIAEWVAAGACLQVTAQSFLGRFGRHGAWQSSRHGRTSDG